LEKYSTEKKKILVFYFFKKISLMRWKNEVKKETREKRLKETGG